MPFEQTGGVEEGDRPWAVTVSEVPVSISAEMPAYLAATSLAAQNICTLCIAAPHIRLAAQALVDMLFQCPIDGRA
ncbi:MAG: hypothetical protein ACUVSF_03995, partial [Anaerolineae bacterium]